MKYIDLFAGAGGLSEGFLRNGFEPIVHIEMNKDASDTLKTRACYYYLKKQNNLNRYYDYLNNKINRNELYSLVPSNQLNRIINETISDKTLNEIFNQIDSLMEGKEQADLIIGGPPCQAYSLVGRAVKDDNMENDPRNYLYKLYCRFLKKYYPRMFVFENVPGLLSANKGKHFSNLKKYLKNVGYEIEVKELNAKDFGVLQNRKRVIIIGWKKGEKLSFPKLKMINQDYTINDLFSDLPSIKAGEENNTYKPNLLNDYLKRFNIRDNYDILTWHKARPILERDKEIYKKVILAWNNDKKRLKYTDLPNELVTHKNTTSFLDRFKVVAGDLKYCHTVLAHISKDGHYFIHPDYNQARSISVREAARIQSFPDNYFFEGSRTSAFIQIGNAVPPLMSEAIAKALKEELEKENE